MVQERMVQALITRENKVAFHRRFETRKNNQSAVGATNKLPINKSIKSLKSDEENDGGNS